MEEETGVPGENQHLTPRHWQLSLEGIRNRTVVRDS